MAYNSRIQPKKRLLDCGCTDYAFSRNRCRRHAAQQDRKPIQRTMAKKKDIDLKLVDGREKLELDTWFAEQRKKLTGRCCNCGQRSEKFSDKYWKWSIAHVLPKNIFKSVATHPDNCIELCIACHTLYDRNVEFASNMPCWPIAVSKFLILEPLVKERHKHLDLFRERIQ